MKAAPRASPRRAPGSCRTRAARARRRGDHLGGRREELPPALVADRAPCSALRSAPGSGGLPLLGARRLDQPDPARPSPAGATRARRRRRAPAARPCAAASGSEPRARASAAGRAPRPASAARRSSAASSGRRPPAETTDRLRQVLRDQLTHQVHVHGDREMICPVRVRWKKGKPSRSRCVDLVAEVARDPPSITDLHGVLLDVERDVLEQEDEKSTRAPRCAAPPSACGRSDAMSPTTSRAGREPGVAGEEEPGAPPWSAGNKRTSRKGISSVKLNASSAAKTVIAGSRREEPEVRAEVAQDPEVQRRAHRGVSSATGRIISSGLIAAVQEAARGSAPGTAAAWSGRRRRRPPGRSGSWSRRVPAGSAA
jgi:hypothetical protein